MIKRLVVLLSVLGVLSFGAANAAQASPESYAAPTTWYGNVALNWSEAHALGHWYEWGGTGPSGYDCSGLVQTAFAHAGIQLPRTTYAMLNSPHLHPVSLSSVKRGDLLFYGSGHVEIATIWHDVSFGAHDSGSTIGWIHWWPGGWQPTMAFEVY